MLILRFLQVFDRSGRRQRKFGSRGTGPGQFLQPEHIALHHDGSLLVVDTDNRRIQCFQADSTFITQFGGFGSGLFGFPRSVCVDNEGRILVGDSNSGVFVFAFD